MLAPVLSYAGMTISLIGLSLNYVEKKKLPDRDNIQRRLYFLGAILLMSGAYLISNWVYTSLQGILAVSALGGLAVRDKLLSCIVFFLSVAALFFLAYAGLVVFDWTVSGPMGLIVLAVGVALIPRRGSNELLLAGGIILLVYSITAMQWPWIILNLLWSITLIPTVFKSLFLKPRT